ncbi:MAG: hypothetical protein ACTSPA_10135, partial [Promethearchaeota archaeon]
LFFTFFALFIIGFSQINFETADIIKENYYNEMIPNASIDGINSSQVFIDKTIVHRGIETLNITYNNTDPDNGVTHYYLEDGSLDFIANITFSDSSDMNISLTQIGATHYWTTLFTPSIFNITGDTNVTILVVDSSTRVIQNDPPSPDGNFNLANNLPKVGVFMNATEVYRNETIKIEYLPSDIENNVMDLMWEIKLFDPTDILNATLVVKGEKNFSSEILIPNSYDIGEWRVEATCWDLEDVYNSSTVNNTFLVKNNEPVIDNILFQFENEDPFEADTVDSLDIFRGPDKYLTVYVNASDIESNEMKLTILATDPISGENLLTNYVNISLDVNNTNNFSTNVSFPITSSIGLTELKIIVLEDNIIQDEYIQEIFIHNNAPILNNFTINGEFGNQTTIDEGDWLSFMFGAEDDEDSIEYVLISIVYYDDNDVVQYLNYSTSYIGEYTEILIRGADLKLTTGIYTVYAYVFDSDGASATCTTQTFGIQPASNFDATTWLLFIIGIIIGMTFTFVGAYTYYRKKLVSQDASVDQPSKVKTDKKSKKKNSVDIEESDEKAITKSDKKSKKKKLIRKL